MRPLPQRFSRPFTFKPARAAKTRQLRIEPLEAREVPAAFTPGDLVVERVGDGATGLVSTGSPVFLDEFNSDGTLVQSIAMPTTVTGSNKQLIANGTSTSEGLLTLSTDGTALVMAGYARDLGGTGAVSGTASATVNRTIGVVSYDGSVDTTTALTDAADGGTVGGVASTNGTDFWISGATGGVRYTTLGATTSTQLSTTATNLRTAAIFDGQLYVSAGTGPVRVGTVGSGTPTSSGQVISSLPGYTTSSGSPYAYFLADLDPGVAGLDTLYVADQTVVGLAKFSLVGGTWVDNGAVGTSTDAYRGVTGIVNGTQVTLYATRKGGSSSGGGGELVKIIDTAGYNQTINGTASLLATADSDTAFRGIALAPVAPNQAPVNTLPSSYTASEDTPKVLDGISVSDVDAGAADIKVSLSITSGTLTLLDNVAGGVNAVQISGNGTTSVLMTASQSAINATLAANGLTYTPIANFSGDVTLTMHADDQGNTGPGGPKTDDDISTITVDPVADTPSVTNSTTNEDTQSSDGGLVISRNAVDGSEVTDFKITNIQHGTLYLNDGTTLVSAGDFVAFADANAGLKFTPAADYFGTGSFDVQASLSASDAGLGGAVVTATITVNPVADTPSVTNSTTDEDSQTSDGGLVISRNAVDGSEVTDFKITNIQHGTLYQNDGTTPITAGSFITVAEGSAGLKFTPAADYFGTGSFDVQASLSASDAGLGGASATATITVNPVADTPSVTNSTTDEDSQTSDGGLVISRNAVDGGEVTDFKITNIQHGTLYLNDGTTLVSAGDFVAFADANAGLKFTPAADYFGTGSFDVQASVSGSDAGLGGSVVTATITVNPEADTPAVTNSTTDEDTQTSDGGLVISRNAADGSEVTDFKITNIQHGTLYLHDGTTLVSAGDFVAFADASAGLKFTPAADYFGTGSFDVQASLSASDAGLGGSVVTATITVNPVADAPAVTPSTTDEDTQSNDGGLAISRNPVDGSEVTDFKITNIQHGTLFQADGTTPVSAGDFVAFADASAGLKFTPAADYFGTGSFDVQASLSASDAGLGGSVVTATITVNPVADTPAVMPSTTDEDSQTSDGGLVISRNAADGSEVTDFKITNIQHGTLFQADGTTPVSAGDFVAFADANAGLKFTPAADYFGTGSFDVQASLSASDAGLGGSVVTASITVNPEADTPSVTPSTTDEDSQTSDGGLVISRNAADGSEVTDFKITNIQHGTLFQADGTTPVSAGDFVAFADANAGLKFTPAADYFGTGSFDVQASLSASDAGLGGAVVTATITVNPVADTPSVTNSTTDEDSQTSDGGLVISRNAVDGSEVTDFKITNIQHGTLYLNDGTTLVSAGDFVAFADANAGLKFTPAADYFGTGSFDLQASVSGSDTGLGGSVVTATITVNPVADTPTVTPAATDEDVQTTSGLVISRNAADGSEVTNFKITNILHGTLFQADGTTPITAGDFITVAEGDAGLKFTPDADYFGNASFDVRASLSGSDAGLGGSVVTANITVTAVLHTPAVTSATTSEDTQTSSGLVITPDALDIVSASHFKITNILNGTLYQNDGTTPIADGDFITVAQGGAGLKFTPNANYFGPASFDVQPSVNTTDAGLGGSVVTATITISSVADTPSVTNSTTAEDTQSSDGGLVISRNAVDGSEVADFKITNIQHGTVYLNDGTTPVANGDFVAFADENAGLKFTPDADYFGTGSFDVQASLGASDAGLGGAVVTATITVNPVADTPSVTSSTTNEDTQSSDGGLVISRNAVDGSEVTDFKITNIQHGTLYLNDGTTPVSAGDFVDFADANTGLKFTPDADYFGTGSFDVQASLSASDAGLGGSVVTATITVNPVADTPSVTSSTTDEDTQSSDGGLVISRNAVDGSEVTDFKITNIQHGTLYLNDGTTLVSAGDFVAFADASAGLKFTPAADYFGTGSFDVQASVSGSDTGLGGSVVTATITVNPVADTPTVTPAATDEDVQTTSGLVISRNAADGSEVTNFKITNILHGTLFQADGTTPIAAGDFITAAEGDAGLKFTPTTSFFGTGSFDLQASLSGSDAGLGGSVVMANITVTAVLHTPAVTSATTSEDTQTSSGLVITPDALDIVSASHFKITNILNGTLYQNDGTMPIADGDFITVAQGGAGLKFTPNANYFGPASFDVQTAVSNTDAALGGTVVSAAITVNPVADTPSVTGATTNEDTPTSTGLVITRNAADGVEVGFFKITNIQDGTLFQADGRTAIAAGDFITVVQGNAGLKFTPTANFNGNASFDVQASLSNADAGLGGSVVTATITVNPVADTPSVTDSSTNEDVETSTGLVITRNGVDGSEVPFYKITNIQHGTLFENDGTTPILTGSFISIAEGSAGLKFLPATDYFGGASFDVQASASNTDVGLGGSVVTATITVAPVADTPSVSGTTTAEDTQSTTGLVITRAAGDGVEVGFFQITNIQHGTLYQNDGTTAIAAGDFITVAQGNAGLKFSPTANFNGNASFDVQASLSNSVGGLGGSVVTAAVTVTSVNDQPVLDASGTPVLPYEPVLGKVPPAGGLVSDLTGFITDADTTDPKGIAVVGVQESSGGLKPKAIGKWEYSIDGGATWTAIGPVTDQSALLLPANASTRVHFLPAKGFTGFASITFKAWDQSDGVALTKVDTTTGDSAFSSNSDEGWVAVGKTKVAIDPDGRTILKQTLSTTKTVTGVTASALLGLAGLEDGRVNLGVAITGATTPAGTWQYQLALSRDKKTWINIDPVSDTSALLLGPKDKLRFVPTVGGADDAAGLTFLTWDPSVTSGVAGDKTDPTATPTAFGTEPGEAVLDLVPVLKLSTPAILTPVNAGGTTNEAAFSDFVVGATHVVGSNLGVAITATKGTGLWEYKPTGGNWTPVGKVSVGKALFLDLDAEIRFTASATALAGSASLSFKAWDKTKVVAGSVGAAKGTLVSKETEIVTASVANTAPVLSTTTPVSITEKTAKTKSGLSVGTLLGKAISDADKRALKGIAITGLDDSNGTWEYSLDGRNWLVIGPVAADNALLLSDRAKLRFMPNVAYTGPAMISYKAWDRTAGESGDYGVDTTGVQNSFSTASATATLNVTA